jgi:hypothetical protein
LATKATSNHNKFGRCDRIPPIKNAAWSRVTKAFNDWRGFEANDYYPQTVYFSQEEARTLTQDAYLKWLREMEEIHIPDRLRKSQSFSSCLEEFREGIGTTDYGSSTVEIVEGLMRASREVKETIAGILDACSQFRSATIEESRREMNEWYALIVSREEDARKLITVISQGLDRVEELLAHKGNSS